MQSRDFARLVAVFAFMVLGADADPAKQQPPAVPTTFRDHIQPILQAKCARCHGQKGHKADLDLTTWAGLLKGGESGPIVVAGKPETSLLYEKVHSGAMPPNKKDRLSAAEVATIRRWIADGFPKEVSSRAERAPDIAAAQGDGIPILLRHCAPCHGLRRQEGGLDLHSRAAALRGGKSGPVIVPGKPDASLLIRRLRAHEMPPPTRLVEASVKLVEPAEIDTLTRWIAAGAVDASSAPDSAMATPDSEVTAKDRDFWAFRPQQPVSVPRVRHADTVRNPIDAFILEKLEARGLDLSLEADRYTLMRRAALDLTGIPPAPAEVDAFVADSAPDAYERMIDRLLASPRYGERWARFWLDLAGYADSEGKREQDLPRPHAWRYRDYVIRALNADKSYDRFLLEQLAGDELADYEHAPAITPELYDNLVATGFLRMAPDPTWANITGFVADRLEVMADEIDVLGSAVLGLTLKCARCHSHKFDPIPQSDYYRLVAIFKGAYDEYDWIKPDVRPGLGPVSEDAVGGRHLPYVTSAERKRWEAQNAKIRHEIEALRTALRQKSMDLAARYRDELLAQLPEETQAQVRTLVATPPGRRDAQQRELAELIEQRFRMDREALKARDPAFRHVADGTDARVQALQARLVAEPRIQALWDRGEPSPSYVYRRGDPLSPGRLVGPGVPCVLTDGKRPFKVQPPWPGAKKTGRRLAFARWLTQPDHPLTARVQVNRLWKHHFGTGIVATLGNFGKTGAAPTHPELLDWLAGEFVRQGFSVKAMHRLMMTSATYRQRSLVTPEQEKLDPHRALYSRMPLVRLDAECLYDTLLAVAGRLDDTPFGPASAIQAHAEGLVTPVASARGWRRLIYVQQTRKQTPTHLENFDFPAMNPNCIERRDSTIAPQALYLLNNAMIGQLAEHFAQRVLSEAGADPAAEVERAFRIALSRPPTTDERRMGEDALRGLAHAWAARLGKDGQQESEAAKTKALATFCHAIMNSAGFLYID
jgi:mono/diheme cytochrome c family protein